ncbi:uncharacterized protein F5891DRAFT_45668 [Suillus fuscotomentosus]|uniref:Uncharacterized protein n=1 Tax=Suillus fuscotomentosus TaxID=1912939 RepID=A0AAD4HPR6_9AGAM|nr:uncharacterized protein F5891DRAFT_45668 [Suillus fuscotomentosus]KAG1904468.1 hypothetical protein F5891DRAFT_45668 [Suillus fuscotomentosus]
MRCYCILHILGRHYSDWTKTSCERYSRVPLYTHNVLRHSCLCWQHISAVYMGMRFSVHSVGRRHKFMPLDPLRCPKSAECIRGLPVRGHPAISSQSCPKMSNGLACHIRDCALFLQCIGPSTVCDVLLCYFPFTLPLDRPDEHYIAQILSIEYGAVVIEHLAHQVTQVSTRERMKMVRKDQKMQAVLNKRNIDVLRRREWPVAVSKDVVLDCLHRYYDASKWIEPPVCVICSQRLCGSKVVVISADADVPLSISVEVL